ncbi:MAG TPA: carbohydrate-binding family 9-like protein, partial [Pyrinomonadaceae bacterium]|nr:carbohydrate-binding family 9-like protein [Pyrinomonadaceae bacterium]
MSERSRQAAVAQRIDTEIAADDFDNPLWMTARPLVITKYWSGEAAPTERHAEARLLWSDEALYVRFTCPQAEDLIVSNEPQTDGKTIGLWDRDVCEIFIAPDAREPERYFEFEAAPTGEWVDLAIKWTPDERLTDWEFNSGMTTAARILKDRITIAMRIP